MTDEDVPKLIEEANRAISDCSASLTKHWPYPSPVSEPINLLGIAVRDIWLVVQFLAKKDSKP